MRLGDLDDLKVHISELLLVYSGEELANAILNAIDNAQTVKTYCYFCGQTEYGIERPQGKWIVSGLDYKCSNCGMIPCFKQYNFCPNCGAKMKGDAE